MNSERWSVRRSVTFWFLVSIFFWVLAINVTFADDACLGCSHNHANNHYFEVPHGHRLYENHQSTELIRPRIIILDVDDVTDEIIILEDDTFGLGRDWWTDDYIYPGDER